MTLDIRSEITRGYVLLFVMYGHALYSFLASLDNPAVAPAAVLQLKFLAPHITALFILSGMGARAIARRDPQQIAAQALSFVLIAILSHMVAFACGALIYGPPGDAVATLKALAKPIVYGKDSASYVSWFFTALAVARVGAFLLFRHRALFVLACLAVTGLVWLAKWLHLPDNIYEWRHWPSALLFFLIGMKIPLRWQVPAWAGIASFAGSAIVTWFNVPEVWTRGFCLDCNLPFISHPMQGLYGVLPLFVVQEILFFVGLLWVAQLKLPRRLVNGIRYLGRYSLQLLLLHGCMIAIAYPFLMRFLPEDDGIGLYVVLWVGNPLIHVPLLLVTQKYITRAVLLCTALANRMVESLCEGARGLTGRTVRRAGEA